jgi:hypothetical protein
VEPAQWHIGMLHPYSRLRLSHAADRHRL